CTRKLAKGGQVASTENTTGSLAVKRCSGEWGLSFRVRTFRIPLSSASWCRGLKADRRTYVLLLTASTTSFTTCFVVVVPFVSNFDSTHPLILVSAFFL